MNRMMYEDYLMHYGVKGMRWGHRKDRKKSNKDRIRLNKSERNQVRKIKRERKKASRRHMLLSDEELNARVKRLESEKRLKDLTESSVSPGKKAAKNFLSNNRKKLSGVAVSAVAGGTAYVVKTAITGEFNAKDAAAYIAPNPNKKAKK